MVHLAVMHDDVIVSRRMIRQNPHEVESSRSELSSCVPSNPIDQQRSSLCLDEAKSPPISEVSTDSGVSVRYARNVSPLHFNIYEESDYVSRRKLFGQSNNENFGVIGKEDSNCMTSSETATSQRFVTTYAKREDKSEKSQTFDVEEPSKTTIQETETHLEKGFLAISRLVSRPWLTFTILFTVGLALPAIFVCIIVFTGPPGVDLKVDSFRINTHPASRGGLLLLEIIRQSSEALENSGDDWVDSYNGENRHRRTTGTGFQWEQIQWSQTFYIYYTTKNGEKRMLEPENLKVIHDFETELVQQNSFKRNCLIYVYHIYSIYASDIDRCFPPMSANGFFYPSPYVVSNSGRRGFIFDGFGSAITDFEASFQLMQQQSNFFSYFDNDFQVSTRDTSYIRSTILMGQPLRGYFSAFTEEQNSKQYDYILSLDELMDKHEKNTNVEMSYFSEMLTEHLLYIVIKKDIMKTFISLAIIAVLVFFFTSFSPWLTLCTIVILIGAIIDNLFLYFVVFGIKKLGMLNAASGILLVAIGVDDILVYINIFRGLHPSLDTVEKVAKTTQQASTSTLLTSVTTALAFGSSLVSPIPAVERFGLFMSLLVLTCWLLVLVIVPPALVAWDLHFPKFRTYAVSKLKQLYSYLKRIKRRTNKINVADSPADQREDPELADEGIEGGLAGTKAAPDDKAKVESSNAGFGEEIIHPESHRPKIGAACSGETISAEDDKYDTTNLSCTPAEKQKTVVITVKEKTNSCGGLFELFNHKSFVVSLRIIEIFTNAVIKLRSLLLVFWLGVLTTAVVGLLKLEVSDGVVQIFSDGNRLEKAILLRRRNVYVPDNDCRTCNPLFHFDVNFTDSFINSTDSEFRVIENERFYKREKRSASGPEKPLSSSRPLIAVILGIKHYSVSSNAFYHTEPEVTITLDDDFLDDFMSYGDMSLSDVVEVTRDVSDTVKALCLMCKAIADNYELVQERRGQCIPNIEEFDQNGFENGERYMEIFNKTFRSFDECQNLPDTRIVSGDLAKGTVGYLNGKYPGYIIFVFESTLPSERSIWEVRDHFLLWRDYLKQVSNSFEQSTGITNVVITSDVFDAAFIEIVAKLSSIYSIGVAFISVSLVLSFFTGHFTYLVTILLTVVSCVVSLFGAFYYAGLKAAAVEVIVASIIIGNSADYVFHLAESYSSFSRHNDEEDENLEASELRKLNCQRAMRRIGLSIISSSLTTALGCLPLTFADLHPLRVFGILIIVSSLSALLFTLLFALPLLAVIGPVGSKITFSRRAIVFGVVFSVIFGAAAFLLILDASGSITIYDPMGL